MKSGTDIKSLYNLYEKKGKEIKSILDSNEFIGSSENLDEYKELYEMRSYFEEQIKLNDNDKIKILSKRFDIINRAKVTESIVHEYGLFANMDIPAGKIITFYPGDAVLNFDVYVKGTCMISFGNASEIFRNRVITDDPELEKYKMIVNKYYSIIGNPEDFNSCSYLAHIANDGEKLNKDLGKGCETLYLINSLLKCNSRLFSILDCHVALIALKDIKNGEEIFCTYGINYWKILD